MVRTTIASELLARILGNNSHVLSYFDLLKQLIQDCPQAILEQIGKIRDTFDDAVYRNVWLAEELLQATHALIRISTPFKDHIMVTLRKGLFSKELVSRQVSVRGYLQLSYALLEKPTQTTESEVLEIIGNLRRALTYDGQVREVLYRGFLHMMKLQPSLGNSILDILLPHCENYLVETEDMPFQLSDSVCVDGIVEPVPLLIVTLTHCLMNAEFLEPKVDSKGKGRVDAMHVSALGVWGILDGLTRRMSKAGAELFGFDKETDYTKSETGKFNLLRVQVICHVMDALIYHVFCLRHTRAELVQDMATLMIKLFSKRKDMLDAIAAWRAEAEPGKKKAVKELVVESAGASLQMSTFSTFCRFLFIYERSTYVF
jgi:Fanconi anemia group I protein